MKSILVIETPKDCDECPLNCECFCTILDEDAPYSLKEKCGCPLKPLPKKKNTDFHPNIVYANGWNDCLKEIQK